MLKKGTNTTNCIDLMYVKNGQNTASMAVFGSFFSTQFVMTATSRHSFIDADFSHVGPRFLGAEMTAAVPHRDNIYYQQ